MLQLSLIDKFIRCVYLISVHGEVITEDLDTPEQKAVELEDNVLPIIVNLAED
jgi:hypothetical protein